MYKPKSLRKALTDAMPELASTPEMMRIVIGNGTLVSTLATSLSFENQYSLTVIVNGFVGDIEQLFVPIQAWLRTHQADMMTTDEGRTKGFSYSIKSNVDDSADISINLILTERTVVREEGGNFYVESVPEPQPPIV